MTTWTQFDEAAYRIATSLDRKRRRYERADDIDTKVSLVHAIATMERQEFDVLTYLERMAR